MAAALVVAGCAALVGLARMVGAPDAVPSSIVGFGALGLAALLPVAAWGRSWGRRVPNREPARFAAEQLLAGVFAAAALFVLIRLLRGRVTAEAIDRWLFPLFPIDPQALLYLSSMLVVQLALCWTAAAVVAVAALRWRITWRRPGTGLLAMVLWIAPALALAVLPSDRQPLPIQALVGYAAGVALFGVLAESIRRSYRRTTQAMRLILVFAALLLPTFAAYPMAAVLSDRASRTLIEREYAPATAQHSRAPAPPAGTGARRNRPHPQSSRLGVGAAGDGDRAEPGGVSDLEPDEPRTRAGDVRGRALRRGPADREPLRAEPAGVS